MVRRAAAPWILAGLLLVAGSLASADDPSPAKPSFAEGNVIGFGDISRLEPNLPKKFWDRTGTAFESEGKVRSFIDVGRLTKGR
jgi:hypothetical protein